MNKKIIYCPVNGWDCPYYGKGKCWLKTLTGCDPIDECDDFAFFWGVGDDYEVDAEED